jgi:DNA-directed RNA polymerase I, II, and III subunit RPABC5|tara:strand:- start:1268 stop:1522 length:255 start_codon:yes stop_codon:yes gene_type:complete
MIIPIRCFTCGKILADKWNHFQEECRKKKMSNTNSKEQLQIEVIDINANEITKTVEGEVLDQLGLTRYCCRKSILTHIDLIEEI